jgi:putative protease
LPPELLAPAGGFDAALAAFQYGADAVYLGLPRFSARADADNLTPDRLRVLLAYARSFPRPKKIYVTLNTLVQDAELPQAVETLDGLDDLFPDGVIVQDLGVARLIRDHFPRLPLHASTQLAAHNLDGVLALRDLGFTRVVLARELTLDEIADIVQNGGVEIEIFIHGALCYSVSGLCLFSSHATGRSGNRGRCAYCCREPFQSKIENPTSDIRFPFSMRDLALAPLLDAVTASGVHSLKIEGRMKSPLYVACVTDYYRRKLDRALTPADEASLVQDLQTVFSRPWTTLYAGEGNVTLNAQRSTLNAQHRSPIANPIDPTAVGHRGACIGHVEAVVRDRAGDRWLRFTTNRALEKHDGLQVEPRGGSVPAAGSPGQPFGFAVTRLRLAPNLRSQISNPKSEISVPAGSAVEVALPAEEIPPILPGSPVFCSASQAVRRRYVIRGIRESELASGRPVAFRVALRSDGIHATAVVADAGSLRPSLPVRAAAFVPFPLTASRQPGQTAAAVRKAFERLGDTDWRFHSLALDDPHALYAPPSKLNEARRAVLDRLSEAWSAARTQRISNVQQGMSKIEHIPDHADTRPPTCDNSLDIGHSLLDIGHSVSFSLKLRVSTPLLSASALSGIDALVLAIGHTPFDLLEKQLAGWGGLVDPSRIRLALPLLTRASEMPALKAAVRRLADAGWSRWECADLAGHRLLSEQGIAPLSADWSLYALNRTALAELARLGIRCAVLSPENSRDNLRALCATRSPPAVEVIAYQHTPLFISETAPALPSTLELPNSRTLEPLRLVDRRGRAFTVQQLDGRWITVSDAPFCIADRLAETGANAFRIDLSWSPDAACTAETVAAVRAGQAVPGTHAANFDRGFL